MLIQAIANLAWGIIIGTRGIVMSIVILLIVVILLYKKK